MILSADPVRIPGITHASRNWEILSTTVTSDGRRADELTVARGNESFPFGELEMNGAGVFNFVVKHVKPSVAAAVAQAGLESSDIDRWYIHQGSRAVVDAVSKTLSLDENAQFVSRAYGNVVGSAIPFQLFAESPEATETQSTAPQSQNLFLLAFGVGLTLAGIVVKESIIRTNDGTHD